MNVDEIRTKYQCDKRQTGQVVVNPIRAAGGNAGFNFRKSGIKDKNVEKALKREIRAVNKPSDPLSNGKTKSTREAKAAFLGVLRNFENILKKSDDKRAIQMAYANMTTKFQDFLKQI